ncbi:MAG: hypothetical protein MSC45_07125 [Mobiluncus sp.]|uniref:hypothetical protein n=1 Tax=Mobiluncus sp. TaxID=47293 RepID=UPI0025898E41|nr:hypothetical protein [Mobiluncus sp.]MCI6584822.1 hypothetical protein [Mobiluncus sp.]
MGHDVHIFALNPGNMQRFTHRRMCLAGEVNDRLRKIRERNFRVAGRGQRGEFAHGTAGNYEPGRMRIRVETGRLQSPLDGLLLGGACARRKIPPAHMRVVGHRNHVPKPAHRLGRPRNKAEISWVAQIRVVLEGVNQLLGGLFEVAPIRREGREFQLGAVFLAQD